MTQNTDAMRQRLENAEDVLPPDTSFMESCPVIPLGFGDGTYHFLSAAGELRSRPVSALKDVGLLDLFGGDISWLTENFPRYREGERVKGGFNQAAAQTALIAACVAAGKIGSNLRQRKCGVWPAEDGSGGIVVHCGDKLFHEGRHVRAGKRIGSSIYGLEETITPLAEKPSTRQDGLFLMETFSMWNLQHKELAARLLTGFIGQAMLGAAPRWRAHIMVNGMNGSGKSLLAEAVSAALGSAAHGTLTNFTEGGLRQILTGEARCMVLDEAEPDQAGRVEAVIELLRHMASKSGSRGVRGSAGGNAQSFNVTGCAYLSSILGVALAPADRQRITCLVADPLPPGTPAAQVVELENRIAMLEKLSPHFRRRMVDRWQQYQENFSNYRAAFMEQAKMSGREGDQIATLMAAADVMTSDYPPTYDNIGDMVALAMPLIQEAQDTRDDGEGPQCLNRMLSFIVDNWQGGGRMTLGQMIIDAIENGMGELDNKKLGTWGLKFEKNADDPHKKHLLIATRHDGLEKVFKDTRWAKGVWSQGLRFVGARPYTRNGKTHPVRIGGALTKAVELPMASWPAKEDL